MTAIDQSALMEMIVNPQSSRNMRREEKELSYKQSMQREWEKAFAEESSGNLVEYEETENNSQNCSAEYPQGHLNTTQVYSQTVNNLQAYAITNGLQNIEPAANQLVIANNPNHSAIINEVINSYSNGLNPGTDANSINRNASKTNSSPVNDAAPVTQKNANSGQLPGEYNLHVSYDGDRVKIWLRHNSLAEEDCMEIYKQVNKFFEDKGLQINAFYLNGKELLSEQSTLSKQESSETNFDQKINKLL